MSEKQISQRNEVLEMFLGITGIYSLYFGEVCMYVGKADCIGTRVCEHIEKGIEFDSVGVIDLGQQIAGLSYIDGKTLINFEEARAIQRNRPKLNRQLPSVWGFFQRLPMATKQRLIGSLPNLLVDPSEESEISAMAH